MPKKAKGKKSGSAKKKKSAKGAKSAKEEGPPPPPPGPSWPWEKYFVAWVGRDPDHRRRVIATFREHYVRGEGIVCSQSEWDATVRCYTGPLANPDAEAMVQMLAVALARPASRTHPADNLAHFTAAIRFRHSHTHFERMYQLMVPFFQQADGAPSVQALLDIFQSSDLKSDTTSLVARVKEALKGLHVTMGMVALPAEGEGAEPKIVWKQAALDKGLMFVFMEFLVDQKERLVDLFFRMDKDRSGTITREEFKVGMQALGIPGTEKQLIDLIDELDTDGDGEMNYKELAEGRVKSVEALRNASKIEIPAAPLPAIELAPSHLSFGFDEFVNMVLHCHYTTRP